MQTLFLSLFGLGTSELIFIGLLILLFFGAKKIPDIARGMGKGIREFKDAMKGASDEMNKTESDIKNLDHK